MRRRTRLLTLLTTVVASLIVLSSFTALTVHAGPPPPPASGGLWDLPPFWVQSLGVAVILGYLTLAVYKENLWSRWAEYSLVGLGVGWGVVVTIWRLIGPGGYLEPLFTGAKPWLIIPVLLGLLLYTQFFRGYRWIMRWPLAIMSALGFTITLTGTPLTILLQLRSVAVPLFAGNVYTIINSVIAVVTVFTTLSYFTFTREHTGALGVSARIGRYVMMLGFGVGFGVALMTQGTYLVNILKLILGDWLGIIA